MVTEEASRRGAKLPANVKTIFQSLNYKETGRGTLLTLTPGSEAREFTGTVSGTNQLVNFFKRHKIDDTPTARGLLGDLVSEEHRDIYMKGETNPRTGFRPQIEAVVKKSLLDRVHVSLGVRFTARVIPRSLPGGVRLWVVEELWNGEAEDG